MTFIFSALFSLLRTAIVSDQNITLKSKEDKYFDKMKVLFSNEVNKNINLSLITRINEHNYYKKGISFKRNFIDFFERGETPSLYDFTLGLEAWTSEFYLNLKNELMPYLNLRMPVNPIFINDIFDITAISSIQTSGYIH
ncbi:hypothetical protein EHP00_506 [Ecytonucleospora hepatopenaei]|uniref:Uncharacterized protein n=1 Tax=Ecytonucleospora hepatopenaei TaxID=646526 RepID=A0A1W0E472_9MICR|nr:hypothetical protein EHP00_506 [Ecytonucleospora hepatopenaei]